MDNVKSSANKFNDLSPLLKEVYPKPRKRKSKTKRFDRIARLMSNPKKSS